MTKAITTYRRELFLKFLGETGNQTLSAERAKVSRAWVCLQRSRDAAFDAACVCAISAARERLAGIPDKVRDDGPVGPTPAPPPKERGKWRYLDGIELVVAGSNKRCAQVRRARVKQWTARVERRFLAALEATCNVKAACAEVGMWPSSAYNHRHRWAAFENAWDAAIECGYARLEAALVAAGCNLFSTPDDPPEMEIVGMTAAQALHLLHMHKHAVRGIGGAPGGISHDQMLERARARLERKMRALRLIG